MMNYITEEIKEENRVTAISACESVFKESVQKITEGNLVFSYKNQDKNSDLIQVTVYMNYEDTYYSLGIDSDDFSVLLSTMDYTVVLPHVPASYLQIELLEKLKECNIPDDILNTYTCMIKKIY